MQADIQVLIDRNFPAMQLSMFYCDPADKVKILAMYGLLATVEESLYRASDPVVSRAKLGWWLEELHHAESTGGVHALTGQLQNCGVLGAWPAALISRLFALAMSRIDASGLNNEKSLEKLCTSMGLIQLELESALHGLPVPDHALLQQWAAINGLVQLFRESLKAKNPSYFWLPLNLCAQVDIERQQVAAQTTSEKSRSLFARIIELTSGWQAGKKDRVKQLQSLPTPWVSKNRHWLILSSLQQRQLSRLKLGLAKPDLEVLDFKALQGIGIGDGWCAWRMARLLGLGKQDGPL